MEKEPTITCYFEWESELPDERQYKQNSVILKPVNALIAVDIPLVADYIHNLDKVIVSQLDGKSDTEKAILTPKGLSYCKEQLSKYLKDDIQPKQDNENDGWETESWGNETDDNTVSAEPADDWGAEFDSKEESENADGEPWNESEEDWK